VLPRRSDRFRRRERVERALEVEPGAAPKVRRRAGHALHVAAARGALSLVGVCHFQEVNGDERTTVTASGPIDSPTRRMVGGTTILVVDDEASIRLLCRINLELEGYRVLEAATLAEARAHLESDDVSVVLLDVHVGADDGYDLLDELRAREADVAVALLSGSARIDRRGDDADAIVGKPFELEELSVTVRRLAGGVKNGDPA
jgi:CheY-like chemotaxis protein